MDLIVGKLEKSIDDLNREIISLEEKRNNLVKRKGVLEEKFFDVRTQFVKEKMGLDKQLSLINSEIKMIRKSFKLKGIQKCLGKTKTKRHLTSSQKQLIVDLKGVKCSICGEKTDLIVGHKVPLNQGGKDEWDNYEIYCKKCELRNNRIH